MKRLVEVDHREAAPTGPQQEMQCPNCGSLVSGKFCSECGQSRHLAIPTLGELISDALNVFFSYDAKLWTTLRSLIADPGGLTVDWVEGRRKRSIGPFQLFITLEAVAFLAHRIFFSNNSTEIDQKTKALTIVGVVFTLGLALLNLRLRRKLVEHLVAGAHLWSMLMLVLTCTYLVVPVGTGALGRLGWISKLFDGGSLITPIVQAVMVVYLPLAIRRIYRLSLGVACAETVALFGLYKLVVVLIERYLFT